MTDNYYSGYTKALLDIRDYLEYHREKMKYNRCYNENAIRSLVDVFIENRHEMIEHGAMNLELVYNSKDKRFIRKDFK